MVASTGVVSTGLFVVEVVVVNKAEFVPVRGLTAAGATAGVVAGIVESAGAAAAWPGWLRVLRNRVVSTR